MAAPICTECPPVAKLQRLIDGIILPEEQSSLTAHLDCCESCQQTIEHLAAGGSGLLDCACSSEEARPEHGSAYWPALRKLEREVVKVAHSALSQTRSADDAPAVTAEPELDFLDPSEQPGTVGKLGRFHVVELIGRGGMGMVLRALDVCLQRQVALKVLDPIYAKNDLARNRFIREARAAASIAHENVVAVHHVEKHREEFPFLVMRLVTGESLQDRLDAVGGALEVEEVLRVGRQVASGLAAAHEQGLIHRDIKPANILLESGTGKVLLTDFGLARAVEDAKLTQTGFVAGTPLYMSPEQARGEPLDHRSDLFSLGSVLYAMCTGSPPFQGSSPFVVLRAVTEGKHRPVREVNPGAPEDLASLIDHLLAKNPDERIQSAAAVADLLEQLLLAQQREPGTTCPLKRSTRIVPRVGRSWFHRHAPMVAGILLGLNGLLLVSEAARLTQWTILGQRPSSVAMPRQQLDVGTGPIWSVVFAPDGKTLAMGMDDGTVRIWDAERGVLLSRLKAQDGPVWKVAFNHDGTRIATVGDDGHLRLWDPTNSKDMETINLSSGARAVAFSPDGQRIAAGTRQGAVRVYNAADGTLLLTMAGHKGSVMALAWSHDGRLLASASGDQTIKVWDVSGTEIKEVDTLTGHTGGVYAVAFDPTRNVVASGSWDHTVRLWDVDKGKEIAKLEGHSEDVWSVAFCCHGKVLVSGSEDRTAKLWDPATGRELRTIRGHTGTIYSVAISPDGKTLATGSRDGTVKLWDLTE
jgi:eukaryotic-like serine/threonine-protein kinase